MDLMTDEPGTLAARLARRIAAEGPVSVDEFMNACLSDPAHGYYRTRDPLGVRGDFITAPEISQMFGELIGLWCVEVWRAMDEPAPVRLIELGPGRGTLMADALRAAGLVPAFLDAARVHLVETNPQLRLAQEQRLGEAAKPPCWHDSFAEVPEGPALVIANEFFDALPVRQLVRHAGAWHERMVDLAAGGGFEFQLSPEPVSDTRMIPESVRDNAHEGDIAEVRPGADALITAFGERASAHSFAALVIDYGHRQSAPGDTLQAVGRHRYADPLASPGGHDLTAHVDFGQLGRSAKEASLAVHGPVSQSRFLLSLGLAERCAALMRAAEGEKAGMIESGARRLADPEGMGALFQVVALTDAGRPPPPPFGATAGTRENRR